jgi:hypothetical protein
MASSATCRFKTGRVPGNPMHTGHTFVLGSAPRLVEQLQKILVLRAKLDMHFKADDHFKIQKHQDTSFSNAQPAR